MDQSRRCCTCDSMFELGDLARLADVATELEKIETLDRQAQSLTALLRGRLSEPEFKLVWKLVDTLEQLTLAERVMGERRLLNSLIHHLPASASAIRMASQHVLTPELLAE